MGQPKLLMPFGSSTILGNGLRAWSASHVQKVIVVVREDDADLQRYLTAEAIDRVEIVIPSSPPNDMKQSVSAALRHILEKHTPESSDAWLLAPADLPNLSNKLINAVIDAADQKSIVYPRSNGRNGHPVLFPWSFAEEVNGLSAEKGINTLKDRLPTRCIEWESSIEFADVNTPDDYDAANAN